MYKKEVLKNGLRVITSDMPQMQSVSIGVWIGVGGRYEEEARSGMSHLVEHMLFKGTEQRTANALKEAIEGIGGTFNGFTTEEVTCYLVKLPSNYLELGLDILSDMALNPRLDPVELEKEKYVILEEIKMYMDQPAHEVYDILGEAMWPGHALGRPITGYIDTVKGFKRDDLIDFANQYYRPSNMTIVACGKNGKQKACLDFAKNVFPAATKKDNFYFEPVEKIHKGAHIKARHKDTKQTHLAFGFHSIPRTHELRYALLLLNIILGGNMSSRLFDRLREKKALCYDISSSVRRYKETGAFVIHAGIGNKKLLGASKEIINELKTLKTSYVTSGELNRAKEYARGQLRLGLEDTAMRMLWLGERIILEGKAPSIPELFKKIDKVDEEDIKMVTNLIFNRKNMNFTTVGPAGPDVKKELEKVLVL